MEIWKDVPGYEGLYEVSNLGRVKSLSRVVLKKGLYPFKSKTKILKPTIDSYGYAKVAFYVDKSKKVFKVHQLVAMAFLNHKPNGHKLVVNHINFIKDDNKLKNIEVITQRENSNRKHLKSTSKYVGVFWNKRAKKWTAKISKKRKNIFLGYFNCETKASEAYQKALSEINQNSSQTKRSNNSQSPNKPI